MQTSDKFSALRQLIREAISDNVRERISGFVDEVVELSKEIASGRDESIKQLKWLVKEVESIVEFFNRNEEKLAVVAFNRLLDEVKKLQKLTGFWNRPKVLGRKQYLAKVKQCAKDIEYEAGQTRHLFSKLKRKTF